MDIPAAGQEMCIRDRAYTILNSLFKMAYLADAIPRNPMDKVARPKPRKGEAKPKEPEAYTAQEEMCIRDSYISVDSADPGAVIDLALEYIRSHQKEVAV